MRFRSPLYFRACTVAVLLAAFLCLCCPAGMQAQDPQPAAPPLNQSQVLHHLNTVITWYRKTKTQVQPVGLPTDSLYQTNATRIAGEVVRLAFASAEKAAPLLPSENAPAAEAATTSHQKLLKRLQDTAAHNAQLQAEIDQLNRQIASASRRTVKALTDNRDRLQGELDLGNSMVNTLTQLANVADRKNAKNAKDKNQVNPNGFEASVTQLKSSLPEIFDAKSQPPASPPAQNINSPTGLIGELRRLYDQSMSLRQIDNLVTDTSQLQTFIEDLRTPLRDQMMATVEQGHGLSAAADNPQPGQTMPTKQDFDAVSARFDQISGVAIPLRQEMVALDESKANLIDWRSSITREYGLILRSVFIRVAIILGVLGFLLLISELWKRMAFRYVADTRRRRQFLLVRRFVIGFLMGLVFILGFVSEFSALATFAGFITAGLAVGLQTILLSVAAYFFLIGRYGIRVGDRISIAGVTGDVVDVGIVRFYLLELAGTSIDLQPTGRVVAFPNSVLFQASTPMYRQVPGTDYTWHEIAIALQASGNHALVEETMMEIVHTVYEKYRPVLDRQQRAIEQRFETPFTPLKPKAQLQLTDAGLEAVVRYPVSLRHNVEADDEITRRLIETIGKDEELQKTVAGLPKIRAAIRG